ncbi:MAG: ring-cleaving dioxygenase [Cyclobacteriaceae bacterium]|nr:ring-cleaving dioxygenase [Cyclobacteriaceae bacterium]
MDYTVKGFHHITAIAGEAKRNLTFYTEVLGLRLVKKTVNFDDPGTYHFYFGNETGTPGTILTFFPWQGVPKGRQGRGMPTEVAYAVPAGSLSFWKERLARFGFTSRSESRFGEPYLTFEDPDGLPLALTEPATADDREPWITDEIGKDVALRGFHSTTLTLRTIENTASVLTEVLGYEFVGKEGYRYRYVTRAIPTAATVDLIEAPNQSPGVGAAGTIHHIAFRVENEEVQEEVRKRVEKLGMNVTPKIDRNYFYSVYFREPGGVLFEIATDNPGFTVDESVSELGTHLMLPPRYDSRRQEIERVLPALA